jgi:DNA polymerase-3 subunit epsilon
MTEAPALPFKLERPLAAFSLAVHDLHEPRIVEIGFTVFYHDGRSPAIWSSLINPEVPIHEEATRRHGISDKMVQACRECGAVRTAHSDAHNFSPFPIFRQIASKLAKGLSDCDFIGYSVKFDLITFAEEMSRAKTEWSYANAHIIDVHRLWQILEPRSLTDAVHAFLHREPVAPNRAGGSATDALAVGAAMLDVGKTEREWSSALTSSVPLLHKLCFPEDANRVDPEGKFIWRGADVLINFGKHKGTALRSIPLDYLRWILEGRFSDDVKRICIDAIAGRFPIRPTRQELRSSDTRSEEHV